MKWLSLLTCGLLLNLAGVAADGQQVWTKSPENPVIEPGPPEAWDSQDVRGPCFLFDDSEYQAWYTGQSRYAGEAICHAASYDARSWTKYALNPVLRRTDLRAVDPTLLFIDGLWKMWYGGATYHNEVYYATSPDGITWDWQSHPGPVLPIGDPGEWDDAHAQHPSVVYLNGVYHLFYEGTRMGSYWGTGGIGHATSTNGINWVKDPSNPVLPPGAYGSWDDYCLYSGGCVTWDGAQFEIWYQGTNRSTGRGQIGHAYSTDGTHWTRDPANPVLSWGSEGEWDDKTMESPSVVKKGHHWMMLYPASSYQSYYRSIGLATAPDTSRVTLWTRPSTCLAAPGETFQALVAFRNNTQLSQTFDWWVTVTSRTGYTLNPVARSITLGPGQTFKQVLDILVPEEAPDGAYTYVGQVGRFEPQELWDSESLVFTVHGS